MNLSGPRPRGVWTVPLSVLDDAFLLDADSDGKLSAAEWQKAQEVIKKEVTTRLLLTAGGKPVEVKVESPAIDGSDGPARVVISFSFGVESSEALELTGKLLVAVDPLHRISLRMIRGERVEDKVLHGTARTLTLK